MADLPCRIFVANMRFPSTGGDGDVKCTYSCDKKSKGYCRANWNEGGGSASGTCIPEGANPTT